MAQTIPPEFLHPAVLIARLEQPHSTGWLRREVWEATQRDKLEELEGERLGGFEAIEAKWADQDNSNCELALRLESGAAERREARQGEFEALLSRVSQLTEAAKQERAVATKLVNTWDVYGYDAYKEALPAPAP